MKTRNQHSQSHLRDLREKETYALTSLTTEQIYAFFYETQKDIHAHFYQGPCNNNAVVVAKTHQLFLSAFTRFTVV